MRSCALFVFSLLFAGLTQAQWKLVKEDQFDEFDTNFWQHELTMGGGGNWEFQMYLNNRSNSFVKDSVLYLRPTLLRDTIGESNVRNNFRYDMWGNTPANTCTGNAFWGCERVSGNGGNVINPIKSARLRTANSFQMQFGKVEVRAQIPRGDWLWPALWMLPVSNSYGEWPASGEIDIMESRGNTPYAGFEGRDHVSSTLHWGPFFPENGFQKTSKATKKPSGTYADDFHVYTLEWTPERIATFVDGKLLLDVPITQSFWNKGGWNNTNFENPWSNRPNAAPFDQPLYFVMNVAVGGTNGFFVDNYPEKPWSNASPNAVNQFYDGQGQWLNSWDMGNSQHPSALKVDYVRFFCLEGHKTSCTVATTKP